MKQLSKPLTAVGLALAITAGGLAPAMAETLKMAWAQDATGLDPHKQTAFSSIRFLELMYEPLVRLDENADIAPALATDWAFNDDATELTMHLAPEATFHNGAPVTSADVKATFERILDEETGASARANYTSITEIATPDDKTVVFKLDGPNVPFLTALATTNASIVPASAIEADTIGTEVIGSGPFKFASWTPNASASLVANADWAGGEVAIDGIDIAVLPDETAILAALRSKQVDFALINDPFVATLIPSTPGLKLEKAPVLSYHVLQLNADRGAMSELKVRQAISCALDRQDILDTALLGEGAVAGPMTMAAYGSDVSDLFCYTQDVAKAKELMAEAGYPDGFTAEVMAATGEPPTAASEAQVIQSQLAEIGIELEIQMLELNVYVDRWLAGDFDMAVALNGGKPDPYTMYNRYWMKEATFQKVAHYIDDDLDSLMNQGRVVTDPQARKEIFAELEHKLVEASPWVWLYTGYSYAAEQEYVNGFTATPTGSIFALSSVTIDK